MGNRGRFVVLIGPDGVGKTSLARRIIVDWGHPTMYLHFRPPLRKRPPSSPPNEGFVPPKRVEPGHPVLGWIRLARSLALFWMGYLRWVLPAVRSGALVVGDRWAYGYVGQPWSLGFAGPSWLALAVTRLMPRPDLLIRLQAPAHVVAARKGDLSMEQIERENVAWRSLPLEVWDLDAEREINDLAAAVAARLNEGG